MTLQQTIDIPADRRVHFDWTLPETTPLGMRKRRSPSPLLWALKKVEPAPAGLGMLTSEQLKTLVSAEVPDLHRGIDVLERREALHSLAWQYGKPRTEHSLFRYAGCLKDSGVFDGDAMDIQKDMRR
ncbi:MAG: hypothetical protein LBS64_00360, partial [Spirochaetaceae bacterium]|nr:hypothetical protein [Spirochaetaceae bacterium]